MNLFDLLAGCLSDGERLRFDLDRAGDALTVVVQPLLKSAPPHLDADRQRLRAALAHPLYLRGTSEQFAEGLADALAEYGAKRRDLHAVAADLDVLDEALRQARQAAHAQRQRRPRPGKMPYRLGRSRRRTMRLPRARPCRRRAIPIPCFRPGGHPHDRN